MKIDRLIGILSIPLQKDKITSQDLANIFEVSRRTILRDVDALSMAGIPIISEHGQGGGISIMEGYKVDRTVLSSEEMKAILTGLQSLDSVSGTNQYRQLMEKIPLILAVAEASEPYDVSVIHRMKWQTMTFNAFDLGSTDAVKNAFDVLSDGGVGTVPKFV